MFKAVACFLAFCALHVLVGCGAASAPGPVAAFSELGATPDPGERLAFQRAIVEISKIEWLHLTNRPYKLDARHEGEGHYAFTFVLTDTPDQTITAKVSPTNVVLTGGWFPPP